MADSLGGAEETKILGPEPADAPKDERRLRIAQLAGAHVTQRLWRHKAVGSMDANRERKTSAAVAARPSWHPHLRRSPGHDHCRCAISQDGEDATLDAMDPSVQRQTAVAMAGDTICRRARARFIFCYVL